MKKNEEKDSNAKTGTITLRCSQDILEFLEAVQNHLNAERPLGVSKITRTDAILTLLNYGVKSFTTAFGDPRKKKY